MNSAEFRASPRNERMPKMAAGVMFEEAQALSISQPERAMNIYQKLVKETVEVEDEELVKIKEQSIIALGELLAKGGQGEELGGLIKFVRPFLNLISKAKAAKLIRALIDMLLDMETNTGQEVELCKECIEWAKTEKRTFLRQALEARLVALYYETKDYTQALQLGSQLLRELKKLDDKMLLVEVQLLESKTYHALNNLQKTRAALTSARTTANSIYCPPKLQAALDLQSGVLHAAEEKDFKTAFSYFYEAFEGYDSVNEKAKAIKALKYMLLMKVIMNSSEDVQNIMGGKLALRYSGREIDGMKSIAKASQNRSLADFKQTMVEYKVELADDPVISHHVDIMRDQLLAQNLCRIIEPYSRVQVDHIAKVIALPRADVEKKLSQMILDKKLNGILDQGPGVLIIYSQQQSDTTYKNGLALIQQMGKVVDALYNKAKKLH